MMKKTIFLISFTLHTLVTAQESRINSENLEEIVLTKNKQFFENEEPAEFPLGVNAFRQLLMKNIQTDMISSTSDIHCELQFVIDKEGNITEIKSIGNNSEFNEEAARALSQIKEKWKPGTLDGIPVRYRMKVPLDLKFNVDENARFPAGEDSFKKRISENLEMKNYQEKKSCIISFVVDYRGIISKISATGTDKSFNKKVIQAVRKIKEKWIPAKLRDIPITAAPTSILFEIN